MPKIAKGELLSNWGNMLGVSRTYYGHNARIKPNDHCFWDEETYIVGWYETDDNMRQRVLERYAHKPMLNEEVFKAAMRSEFPDVRYNMLEDQAEHIVTITVDGGDCEAICRAALRIIPAVWAVKVMGPIEIKPSRLTKFLQWGEEQSPLVQAMIVTPIAVFIGLPLLFFKKLARKINRIL